MPLHRQSHQCHYCQNLEETGQKRNTPLIKQLVPFVRLSAPLIPKPFKQGQNQHRGKGQCHFGHKIPKPKPNLCTVRTFCQMACKKRRQQRHISPQRRTAYQRDKRKGKNLTLLQKIGIKKTYNRRAHRQKQNLLWPKTRCQISPNGG